jgi:hypothetical protein
VSLPKNFKPAHNYKEKYQHIIGLESAKEAAKKTETNKQYGFGKNHLIYFEKIK